MISNQILQNTIDGLKGITRVDMCIIDTEGKYWQPHFPMQIIISILHWHL